jgi:hypothetical protein
MPLDPGISKMNADEALGQLVARAGDLRWQQSYGTGEVDTHLLRNYGRTLILGPAPMTNERIGCGFLLLGLSTLYPRHRHEAEEIYIPLSGTAHWQQGDAVDMLVCDA